MDILSDSLMYSLWVFVLAAIIIIIGALVTLISPKKAKKLKGLYMVAGVILSIFSLLTCIPLLPSDTYQSTISLMIFDQLIIYPMIFIIALSVLSYIVTDSKEQSKPLSTEPTTEEELEDN